MRIPAPSMYKEWQKGYFPPFFPGMNQIGPKCCSSRYSLFGGFFFTWKIELKTPLIPFVGEGEQFSLFAPAPPLVNE